MKIISFKVSLFTVEPKIVNKVITYKSSLMKTDLYTKIILTVIAVCLSLQVAKEFDVISTAYASSDPALPATTSKYKLIEVDENNVIDVRLVDVNTYDELNVNLKSVDTYDEVKVNLKSIDTSDELDINIDEIGGNWISSGGPLPVKIN